MNKKFFVPLILLIIISVSCNKTRVFEDFKYQTVYFAYQYPVRTITLGEDVFSTVLDNQHKCQIVATTGGVYECKNDVTLDVSVNNSLISNSLLFGIGKDNIVAMPSNYYTLASNKIVIPKGGLTGGVEVQLTDAFFADPKAIKNTYVIPLSITKVVNADSILAGKDFIFYAIKYVNQWHGNYLRRGKDVITGSVNQTNIRHNLYVEQDAVVKISTLSMSDIEFPLVLKDKNGVNINCTLVLKFDNAGKCTVSAGTANITASGTGQFVKKGEINSWGSKDRDAIYMSYEVNTTDMKVVSSDTMVARDRAVTMETFTPVIK